MNCLIRMNMIMVLKTRRKMMKAGWMIWMKPLDLCIYIPLIICCIEMLYDKTMKLAKDCLVRSLGIRGYYLMLVEGLI